MDGVQVEAVIRTDKSHYTGGDVIYGSVYASIPSESKATSVKLVIRGHELCEYDYQYMLQQDTLKSKLGQRKARKDLLRIELKLAEYADGCPGGYFAYPFQYQLPHGLPGVFNAKYQDPRSGRVWQGVIKYIIGAIVETPENLSGHKLLGETSLVVLDSIECAQDTERNKKTDTISAVGSVKTFFCIHRGDIKLSSSLDRVSYGQKEKVSVQLQLENSSAVDVAGITLKVIRVIKLYGLDKAREEDDLSAHTVYDTLFETLQTGCLKNSTEKSCVEVDLKDLNAVVVGVPPTTSGSLIKCSYVVDLDVHVPWSLDIEVRLPLLIKPSADKQWSLWQPPQWTLKCKQVQVIGQCAVPASVLESQSFSGMPSFQPVL